MTVLLPAWLQVGSYSAEVDRSLGTALLSPSTAIAARGGVRYCNGTEFQVLPSSPAAMTVTVNPGMAWVQGTWSATQGAYTVVNDNIFTVTLNPANSQPRIDLVILEVLDQLYNGSTNLAQVRVVSGTASSSPAVPSATGSYIVLAQVTVPANTVSIIAGNIADARPYGSGINTPIPVRNLAERATLPLREGLQVYRMDNAWEVNTYSGGSWYGATPQLLNVNTFSYYSTVTDFNKRVIIDRAKISDPGWLYYVRFDVSAEVNGARVNGLGYVMSTNSTTLSSPAVAGQSLTNTASSGTPNRMNINESGSSQYSGNSWISVTLTKDSSESSGTAWNSSTFNFWCQLTLLPARPGGSVFLPVGGPP